MFLSRLPVATSRTYPGRPSRYERCDGLTRRLPRDWPARDIRPLSTSAAAPGARFDRMTVQALAAACRP